MILEGICEYCSLFTDQVKLASLEKLLTLYEEGDPNQRINHLDQFRHVCSFYSFLTNSIRLELLDR